MKNIKSLQDKALIALKQAVREVVERHKKTGRPLSVWKNGKVVRISPTQLNAKNNIEMRKKIKRKGG